MKSISFFSLVLLILGRTLAYWTVEVAGNFWETGACPYTRPVNCYKYDELCHSDWQCPGNQKCCQDTCVVRCMHFTELPRQAREKPGKCPQVFGECMMLNSPNQCETDGKCDKDYKCCKGICGKSCVKPLRECMMLNPPNHCETDGECDNNYKCCKGMCGKACIKPLRESSSKGGRY